MGLLAAAVLGSFRFFGDDGPVTAERLFADTVFTLVYTSPYLLTLAAARAEHPSARGGLLIALGTLSLIASFSTFSLITLILLPATGAMAAAWSLRSPGRRLVLVPPYLAAGLICGTLIALSFVALFAFEADESRCWTLVRNEEGRREWESRPNGGEHGRVTIVSDQNDIRSTCSSDIITDSEGLSPNPPKEGVGLAS